MPHEMLVTLAPIQVMTPNQFGAWGGEVYEVHRSKPHRTPYPIRLKADDYFHRIEGRGSLYYQCCVLDIDGVLAYLMGVNWSDFKMVNLRWVIDNIREIRGTFKKPTIARLHLARLMPNDDLFYGYWACPGNALTGYYQNLMDSRAAWAEFEAIWNTEG